MEEKQIDPRLTDDLVKVILEQYEPCRPEETDEFKTTIDLINDFSDMIDTDKDTLVRSLKQAGFKPWYSGDGGFFWPMRPKH